MTTTVVVTGSTRGIGKGLAREFLKRGCEVVVSGRSDSSVQAALEELKQDCDASLLHGHPCEMTEPEQVQALWDSAIQRFGKVDYWVNNAGVAHLPYPLWEFPVDEIHRVVDINTKGVFFGCKVAMHGMLQQGHGQIFNMEGLGSDGRHVEGMGLYGSTKRSLRYLTHALALDAKNTPVKVGTLSPGMVVTDLLLIQKDKDPETFEKNKKIFNILADKVETVTPYLVEKMLKNQKHGAHIAWLTGGKIALRFMTAPFSKRDLFADA